MKLNKNDKRIFYALMFPALIEVLLSKVFLIADSIMLGQMADSTLAVAAVGLCEAPINLIICVTNAFFCGATAIIAWYYGANEKRNMRTVAWQSLIIGLGIATLFTVGSLIFAEPIMRFVCGNSEALEIATRYYRINAYGFFFQIITFNITAIFRGIGVSKLPMYYNVTAGVINVILNYVLIFGKFGFPEMRVEGAAVATVISKGVAFIIALIALAFTKTEISYKLGINKKFDHGIKTRLLPIGLTAAGEQIVLQAGAVISSRILAGLPTAQIASYNIASNMESFAWATGSACQTAATSLFGRALGSGSENKAKNYLAFIMKWAIGFSVIELILFIVLKNQVAILFTNDTTLYPIISVMMIISGIMLPFVNGHQTISGALRSAGDSIAPLIASFVSLWVFRVLGGYICITVMNLDVYAYKACIVVDQFVRCLIVSIFYLSGHWKKFVLKKRD